MVESDVWKMDEPGLFGDSQRFTIFSFENTKQGIMMMNIRGFAETEEQGKNMAMTLAQTDEYHQIQMVPIGNWFKLHQDSAVEKFEDARQQEIVDSFAEKKKKEKDSLEEKRQKRDKYMREITQNPTKNTLHLYDRITSYVKTVESGTKELIGWETYLIAVKKRYCKKVHADIKKRNNCKCHVQTNPNKKSWETESHICYCSHLDSLEKVDSDITFDLRIVIIDFELGVEIENWDLHCIENQTDSIEFKRFNVISEEKVSFYYIDHSEQEVTPEIVVDDSSSKSSVVDLY